MLPPPPGSFLDREELIQHVGEFGVTRGYIVTIKQCKKDKIVVLGYQRGGVYRNRRKSVDDGTGVSISSENSLRVISVFGYTTIVVYDGLMRVTDGNKVQMNTGVKIKRNEFEVGTTVGDIGIWEVGSREKLVLKNFKVKYLNAASIS
ncbi:methylmalonate-semialdehyde dehydrogenase [acylating], mitochondrial-like protein isoform X1 [Tanacetum coccineum]